MANENLMGATIPLIIGEPAERVVSGEGQCDCACVAATPAISKLPPQIDTPFQLNSTLTFAPLSPDYYSVWGQSVRPLAINRSALSLLQHFSQPRSLTDLPENLLGSPNLAEINLVLDKAVSADLLQPASHTPQPAVEYAVELSAWLHVTDRCNLRCAYCYLPHKREDLSLETGKEAIDAVYRSAVLHGYERVKLKYAGGEPLIRFPLVTQLHDYALMIFQHSGIALDGIVLTNATLLTEPVVQHMQALGLRLMVSLDGFGEAHDKQRYYADHRASFEDVMAGILLAVDHNLVPDISVTVSGRNAAGLPEVVSWLVGEQLPFSLNFYRSNPLSARFADLQLEEEQIIEGMLAAFKEIEANLPERSVLASLVDRANLAVPHFRTCGVGQSYLVIDHTGQVSKCQMAIGTAVTDVKATDPLALIRADKIGIQNISVEEKEGCRGCEWKYWCAGGCSLATYRATGRYDVQSPNCNIYKQLYPEAVRLEGLRLLKVNGLLYS
jgi:uncharacterized protein